MEKVLEEEKIIDKNKVDNNTDKEQDTWLTSKQASVRLGVSERTFRRWRSDGQIPMSTMKRVHDVRGFQLLFKEVFIEGLAKKKELEQGGQDRTLSGHMSSQTSGVKKCPVSTKDRDGQNIVAIFEEVKKYQLRFTQELIQEKALSASRKTALRFLVFILALSFFCLSFVSWYVFKVNKENKTTETLYQNKITELNDKFKKTTNDLTTQKLELADKYNKTIENITQKQSHLTIELTNKIDLLNNKLNTTNTDLAHKDAAFKQLKKEIQRLEQKRKEQEELIKDLRF